MVDGSLTEETILSGNGKGDKSPRFRERSRGRKAVRSSPSSFLRRVERSASVFYEIFVNFDFSALQTGHLSGAWPYTVLPQISQTKMSCPARSFPFFMLASASA